VFCENEHLIYSPLDGKRKRNMRLQRFANLKVNPKATLLLDEYAFDWQYLWWVRIDGVADWYEPSIGEAKPIAARLIEKYPQYQVPSLMFDTTVYLRFRPLKVTAWAQSNSPETIDAAVAKPHREYF
jgi:PPOX class probable F420-dependent enzyme